MAFICLFLLVLKPRQSSDGPPSPSYLTYIPPQRPNFVHLDEVDRYALAIYAQERVKDSVEPLDLPELSRRVRLYGQLRPWARQGGEGGPLGEYLERGLFKYVFDRYGSIRSLLRSFYGGGRGIVMTTGDNYFQFAVHAIRALRLLQCNLPIEVWYNGLKDLNQTNIRFLSTFHQVRLRDIRDHFTVPMETWDIKPFAVLASRFQELILMDADAVFLQNPETLFDDPGYVQNGTLFFKDRSLFSGDLIKAQWTLTLFPSPLSDRVSSMRLLQGRTQYELESGVVVMDKVRHLVGLLAVGMLNCPGPIKEMIRQETHGEKETFWIGLEMANEPYSFMPHLPGSLGTVSRGEDGVKELCGKLLHFDRQGHLLWFNDAIAASKLPDDFIAEPADLTHYARESEGHWNLLCLRGGPFHSIPSDQLVLIDRLKRLYRFDPKNRQNTPPPPPEEI